MKVNSSWPNFVFVLLMDILIAYISWNNSKKMHIYLSSNFLLAMSTLRKHLTEAIQTFASHLLETASQVSNPTVCVDLMIGYAFPTTLPSPSSVQVVIGKQSCKQHKYCRQMDEGHWHSWLLAVMVTFQVVWKPQQLHAITYDTFHGFISVGKSDWVPYQCSPWSEHTWEIHPLKTYHSSPLNHLHSVKFKAWYCTSVCNTFSLSFRLS